MTDIILHSHENLSTTTEGLFERKRCNTAPGSLADLLNPSPPGVNHLPATEHGVGWSDHSFVGYMQSERNFVEVATERHSHRREGETVEERLAAYNRRMSLDVFRIKTSQGSESSEVFEGALRFYVNDDNRKLCKAIHMSSTDTVTSLLPVIKDKFSCLDISSTGQIQVVLVGRGEERVLPGSARPLDIAISNTSNQQARFVVRVQPIHLSQNQNHNNPVKISTHHRSSRSRTPKGRKTENGSVPKNINRDKEMNRSYQSGGQTPEESLTMDRRKDSPAAALIDSQRRKKRESSVDDKPSLGRRSGSLRSSRSKSMSSIFQKTFSFRKKEHPYHPPRTELSTEDTAPGVLRIFGDAISPGTQYKSVLASSTSTAELLVKDALERYSIPSSYARHFVMCDVIGQFVPYDDDRDYMNVDREGLWQEECIRIIGDNERPLILQSFWKPSEGYSRRFELRNRGEFVAIENFEYNPYCESSTPIPKHKSGSKKHKKGQSRKTKSCNLQGVLLSESSGDNLSSGDNISRQTIELLDNNSVNKETVEYVNKQAITPRSNQEYANDQMISPIARQDSLGASIAGEDTVSISRIGMSNDAPFIMNLKGIDPQNDNLVHFLSKECTVIGCDLMKLGQSDICLPADDILSLHCRLRKDKIGKCSVEPCQGALVKVNNRPILQGTAISPGDILCLGKHYIFMFRDSTLEAKTTPAAFAFVKLLQSGNFENESGGFYYNQDTLDSNINTSVDKQIPAQNSLSEQTTQDSNLNKPINNVIQEPVKVQNWRQEKCEKYEQDKQRLKLSYSPDKDEEVITFILHSLDSYPGVYRLTPAYLICMCIEYSAVRFEQLVTRQLLLKLASRMQATILDKTKLLADRQGDTSANPSLDDLLPDLQPVITWLANSLEVLHFLNTHMADYVLDPAMSLPAETRHSIVVAEEEVTAVLEDVVMYTFQQTVYYITKTLYSALTAVLDSNPFNEDDSSSTAVTMESLLSIYQTTLNFLLDCSVHPLILSQLFSYLFFFMNTSLLNTLLAQDATSRYYRWSSGVRLRGNLDAVESWAQLNHLQTEAGSQLTKLNCLVNLLATPKVQLVQSDWHSLRRDFPALTPSQLHHVLCHYNIQPRPKHWGPGPDDRQEVQLQDDLSESFNSHPPLVLPGDGFLLDLCRPMDDPHFYHICSELEALFGTQADDVSLYSSHYNSRGFNKSKPQHYPPTQDRSMSSHCTHNSASNEHNAKQSANLHCSTNISDNLPWYKESPPDSNHHQKGPSWSSGDYSYNDSGFATLRSQEFSANSKESLQRSSVRINRSHDQTVNNVRSSNRSHEFNENNIRSSNRGSARNMLEARDNVYRSSGRINKSHDHQIDGYNSPRQNILTNRVNKKDISCRSSGRETRSHQHTNSWNHNLMSNNQDLKTDGLSNVDSSGSHKVNNLSGQISRPARNLYLDDVNQHNISNSDNNLSRFNNSHHQDNNHHQENSRGHPSDDNDPLYMNMGQVNSSGQFHGNNIRHMTSSSSKSLTHNPVAFSTPYRSSSSSSSSGGQGDKPAPILDRSTKPKPLNRVPPLDLHKLREPADYVDVNKESSLSPRATQNGLRVLPLTTDDRSKLSPRATNNGLRLLPLITDDHSNAGSPMVGGSDRQMVRESDMDELLYRDTMSRDVNDDVFTMEIDKTERGLGLGLIDGLYTPLRQPGIFVRTLIPGAPAAMDGRIRLGDRILAVNASSIVGADYQSAMNLIKDGGRKVTFVVAKSDKTTRMQITASSC